MDRIHLWDNWSDSDEEEEYFYLERRQYKMTDRINMDKWDDEDFFCRFRLSKSTVAQVLNIIRPCLQYKEGRSRYIEPFAQLLIALRFYAIGSFQITVADFAGVCQTSVCVILKRVTAAIAAQAPNFIQMPQTSTDLIEASKSFYSIARFPKTIGAIDCTHVKIQSPGGEHAENFRNRKGWFSLNVQTVCSASLKVLNIVARWPGASHDQTIFNNSYIKICLERGDFGQFIIVGDSGYRNTAYLATPFLHCNTEIESLYNESQIRTRNVVERAYGVMKRRFPVLSLGMRVSIETIQQIIVACAILHNIAIDAKEKVPTNFVDGFDDMLVAMNVPTIDNIQRNSQNNIRARLVSEYFPRLLSDASLDNSPENIN